MSQGWKLSIFDFSALIPQNKKQQTKEMKSITKTSEYFLAGQKIIWSQIKSNINQLCNKHISGVLKIVLISLFLT